MEFLQKLDIGLAAFGGIFLGVLILFEGARQLVTRSESHGEARNRRMRLLASGATTGDMLELLRPVHAEWRFSSVPFIGTLPESLRQAGLSIRPMPFLLICLLSVFTVSAVLSVLVYYPVAIAVSVLLFLVIPVQVVRIMQRRRMEKLIAQLPDALDLMARGLRVGHPLPATIASVARDMSDPVASEFGVMVDQVSYGEDLVSAFADFAQRTGREDVRYLAVSVAIQHGTSGNLSLVLDTLAKVIRDRIALRKRIKALSAEGRLTSMFLSCLPFLIVIATTITAPDYYPGVKDDPLFLPFVTVIGVLVLTNFLVMRRLVHFRF
jgi:tight adherence protein B